MSNIKAVFVLVGLAACGGSDPNTMTGDDVVDGDDAPPFTDGVSTLTGHADAGYVDGARGLARLHNPVGCAYRDGKVYVADFDNSKIRVVDAETGQTATLISQQGFQRPFAMTFAPDGALYVSTDRGPQNQMGTMAGTIWRVDVAARTATPVAVAIGRPRGLAFYNGKIVATDYQNHVVSLVDPASGAVQIIAGTWQVAGMIDAVGTAAQFNAPYGVVVKDGKLIVADYGNHRLREVTLEGSVRTLAGDGVAGFADGAMTTAKFSHPQAMAITASQDVYVTDLENFRVRKINGDVETVAGSTDGYLDSDDLLEAQFHGLEGLCVTPDGSMLFVADGTRGESVPYNRIRSVKL